MYIKKEMKIFILVVFYFILFNLCILGSNTKIISFCDKSQIESLINSRFPNYALIDLMDSEKYTREYFTENYKNHNPAIIIGDYDGNNFKDIAILIKNKKRKIKYLAIFFQNDKGFNLKFKSKIEYIHDVFILPIRSGTVLKETEAVEKDRKIITLKRVGVHLFYFEKSSVAFYWNDKLDKIESIYTSD